MDNLWATELRNDILKSSDGLKLPSKLRFQKEIDNKQFRLYHHLMNYFTITGAQRRTSNVHIVTSNVME